MQQQEEEEAEKGGRRKKEVEILREAEGKKGGRPVTAVKSPPPSSLLLLLSHPPPPYLCPSPTALSRRARRHPSTGLSSICLPLNTVHPWNWIRPEGDPDEGSFAGGRTGTSICVPELETPSSSARIIAPRQICRSLAALALRHGSGFPIFPASLGRFHLSRYSLSPCRHVFFRRFSVCNQSKSGRYDRDTLLPLK